MAPVAPALREEMAMDTMNIESDRGFAYDSTATKDMAFPAPMGGSTGVANTSRVGIMPPVPADGFVAGEERAIVKTANLSAVVEDVRKAVDEVNTFTKEVNGYVTSSNVSDGDYAQARLSAYLTLRIPADSLESTMAKIRGIAVQVTNETTTASDQTKQKLDLEAQLKNLRATEEQLTSIMKQAKTVTETLQVQSQLTQTRQQIEMLEAQQQNLTSNVAMATLNVQLRTKAADVTYKQDSIVDETKLALKQALQVYRNLFIAGIRIGVILAPLVLVLALLAVLVKARKPKLK